MTEPATQRLEFVARAFGRREAIKDVAKLLDLEQPADQPAAVLALLHRHRQPLFLRGHIADDRLHQVDQRDPARHSAELVDHEPGVISGAAEVFQQRTRLLKFRDQQRRLHDVLETDLHPGGELGVAVLHRDHADQVVALALIDREKALVAFHDARPGNGMRLVALDPHHLRPRDHDVVNHQLVETEDAFHHAGLGALDATGHHALADQHGELVAGQLFLAAVLHPAEAQQGGGGPRQQRDEGRGDRGQPGHRP